MPTANKEKATTGIPNLWPVDQVRVDVLTPLAILRVQAAKLKEISRGLLEAEVATTTTDKRVSHSLDVIAPMIHYRQSLLTVTHARVIVYPAGVSWATFDGEKFSEDSSQEELITTLGEILKSGYVISVLQSLLAQVNDTNREEFSSEAA